MAPTRPIALDRRLGAVVYGRFPAETLMGLRDQLSRLTCRDAEVVALFTLAAGEPVSSTHLEGIESLTSLGLPGGSPGALRNRAVAAGRADYWVFVNSSDRLESAYLEQACRALDNDPALAFVTPWHKVLPRAADRDPQPVTAATLLGRPWFNHLPTVFRKQVWQALGGFDETLLGGEDVDLWLRTLEAGRSGVAIEAPHWSPRAWGPSLSADAPQAKETARSLFERHRAVCERDFEELAYGKERTLRSVVDRAQDLDRRRAAFVSELESLAEERRILAALILSCQALGVGR